MAIDKHVIDTNVLLVASSAHETSPFTPEATPVEDATLRSKVLNWLIEFEQSDRKIVLDWAWIIVDEYKGVSRKVKLTEQDYGLQVVLHKFSTGKSFGFLLDCDANGHALITDKVLESAITDLADRKMVAGVLAAGGRDNGCNLVNACDTDWYDCQNALETAGVDVFQVIGEEWCFPRWQAKKQR